MLATVRSPNLVTSGKETTCTPSICAIGVATVASPSRSRVHTTDRLSGTLRENVVPRPRTLRGVTVPRTRSIAPRTMSSPTPRPLISVTVVAVEKPGRQIRSILPCASSAAASAALSAPHRHRRDVLGIDPGPVVADRNGRAVDAVRRRTTPPP